MVEFKYNIYYTSIDKIYNFVLNALPMFTTKLKCNKLFRVR